ncbi:hypothetical protein ILUMI_26939 [Ignelater luminosus]|uniref:Uncharacterized protein n=1 Tax=Ignelater luminosus TaxID=2038154 RepID=A0A8K0FX61_IGNLU|nr:hypothetical protein ILUMI_26939 [Ignelater luminosus]
MSSKTKRILDMCNNEDNQPKKLAKEAENDEFDILAMPVDITHDNKIAIIRKFSEDENNHEISRSSSDLSDESLHVDKENEPNNVNLRKPTKTNRTFGVNIRKINQEKRMKRKAYLGYQRPANQTNSFHDTKRAKRTLGSLPGKKAADTNVMNLKYLKCTPKGLINYKINFDNDHQPLSQRTKNNVDGNFVFGRLHKERLKIKQTKFQHLQQLKPVLPEDFWSFYDNLPYYE